MWHSLPTICVAVAAWAALTAANGVTNWLESSALVHEESAVHPVAGESEIKLRQMVYVAATVSRGEASAFHADVDLDLDEATYATNQRTFVYRLKLPSESSFQRASCMVATEAERNIVAKLLTLDVGPHRYSMRNDELKPSAKMFVRNAQQWGDELFVELVMEVLAESTADRTRFQLTVRCSDELTDTLASQVGKSKPVDADRRGAAVDADGDCGGAGGSSSAGLVVLGVVLALVLAAAVVLCKTQAGDQNNKDRCA